MAVQPNSMMKEAGAGYVQDCMSIQATGLLILIRWIGLRIYCVHKFQTSIYEGWFVLLLAKSRDFRKATGSLILHPWSFSTPLGSMV